MSEKKVQLPTTTTSEINKGLRDHLPKKLSISQIDSWILLPISLFELHSLKTPCFPLSSFFQSGGSIFLSSAVLMLNSNLVTPVFITPTSLKPIYYKSYSTLSLNSPRIWPFSPAPVPTTHSINVHMPSHCLFLQTWKLASSMGSLLPPHLLSFCSSTHQPER